MVGIFDRCMLKIFNTIVLNRESESRSLFLFFYKIERGHVVKFNLSNIQTKTIETDIMSCPPVHMTVYLFSYF